VADRHQRVNDPLARQSRSKIPGLNHLADHGSGPSRIRRISSRLASEGTKPGTEFSQTR
jgi:hypothetical protein